MSVKTPLLTKRNISSIVTPKPHIVISNTATPNDDAKERKQRRKSAMQRRISELATPKPQALAASMKALNRVEDGDVADSSFDTIDENFSVQIPSLTPEELNKRFEEWMKIAADNKINVHNTWDFALIDYFYDMRLLKDGGNINFQRASCTLDGCVKIYSSRVDSVATETGKLLTGLAEAPSKKNRNNSDDEDENTSHRKTKKRGNSAVKTLVTDFSSISLKKFDLELSVDPLFKKASADFDEGGSNGLLLKNLDIDKSGKILFDSGASVGLSSNVFNRSDDIHTPDSYNPTFDQTTFDILSEINSQMAEKQINTLLHNYVLEKDNSIDFDLLVSQISEIENKNYESDDENMDDNMNDNPFMNDEEDKIDSFLHFGNDDFPESHINETDFDTNIQIPNDSDKNAVTNQQVISKLDFNQENDFFSYFDANSSKSWAGPEHWKIPVSKPVSYLSPITESADVKHETTATKSKKKKEPFIIDFSKEAADTCPNIYDQPVRISTLQLSKASLKSNKTFDLPSDMQFNSKKMFSLFLKPTVEFRARRANAPKGAVVKDATVSNTSDSGAFSIENQHNNDDFDSLNFDDEIDDYDSLSGIPAVMEQSDSIDYDGSSVYDQSQLSQQQQSEAFNLPKLKVIKPLYLSYAKVSKKVDVKKLKDNIWKKLSSTPVTSESSNTKSAADSEMEIENKCDSVEGEESVDLPEMIKDKSEENEQSFSQVVSGLKSMYPAERLKDISVSFCFICLLHLANEKGLEIESNSNMDDLIITNNTN
ncbi:Condensin complex subunit 2 [Smittium culicis]|uniref:Condensin complex subunit 2 n=1 Tax=Smittium culicis TaxID=133412 RepID=A0A1R1YF79_9FUNG|nr:Condensin complex subunit 2 [Smittium culicis]